MSEEAQYKVGPGRPPLETRFKKNQPSANPRGRSKQGPVDLNAFFDEPVVMVIDGESKKLHPLEVMLTNLLERAVKKRDLRAAERFIDFCAEAGLLNDPQSVEQGPIVYQISSAWTKEEWMEHYHRLGPPPWPGARNGHYNDNWREEIVAHLAGL